MLTNGSAQKRANMARPGSLFASWQCRDHNSGSSDNGSRTAPGKDSQSGKQASQYHLPHGYGYPVSPQPFPGASQFYHHSPLTWHTTVHNQQPVLANYFEVMGHSGKGMTSTKVVMASLKLFPSRKFQDKGRHLQVHREYLQDCQTTVQSIGQHLPAVLLHLDLFPVHLEDHPLDSQRNNYLRLRINGNQMSRGLQTCPHYRRFPMTIMMQMMSATIHQTWAVQRANSQSAWSKPNSPWSNLP